MAAIRRYNLQKVLQNLQYIYEADLTSKGVNASMADEQLMKELLFKLMH